MKEPGKTVAFKIESEEEFNLRNNLPPAEQSQMATSKSGIIGSGGGKGLKWFQKIDFDIQIHASFVGFAMQCLTGVRKCESLVDLSNRIN